MPMVSQPQIGYLFGGWLTMGMALSLPFIAIGVWSMVTSRNREPSFRPLPQDTE